MNPWNVGWDSKSTSLKTCIQTSLKTQFGWCQSLRYLSLHSSIGLADTSIIYHTFYTVRTRGKPWSSFYLISADTEQLRGPDALQPRIKCQPERNLPISWRSVKLSTVIITSFHIEFSRSSGRTRRPSSPSLENSQGSHLCIFLPYYSLCRMGFISLLCGCTFGLNHHSRVTSFPSACTCFVQRYTCRVIVFRSPTRSQHLLM